MSEDRESRVVADEEEGGASDLRATVGPRPAVGEGVSGSARSSLEVSIEAESIFRAIDLFEDLEREEVREIVGAAQPMRLGAGEVLFEQGEPSDALFVIEHGEFQVRAASGAGEDIVLAMLSSGTVVGEMSLIGGGARSATVEAVSEAQIYRLDATAFAELRRRRSPAAYKIILRLARVLGERRRQTDARLAEVFADPAKHLDTFESQVHDILARIRKA